MTAAIPNESPLLKKLPAVRGVYRSYSDLSKVNWFNIGGPAEVIYRPADVQDLSDFLKNKPKNIPVTVIGVGSNLLVRDGGIKGVVIRLGKGFTDIEVKETEIKAGAGALDLNVSIYAREKFVAGLEFLSGIPGTIGGALAMNGGAYGSDISKVLVNAEALDEEGRRHKISNKDMGFSYRKNSIPKNWIFTSATLKGEIGKPEDIAARMEEINRKREETQPIRTKTSGSTFKNPEGHKAWELIDAAGCRGLKIGGAVVSDKHCNFFINTGNASARDMEELGEEVRKKVFAKTGIMLEWEVQIIGERKII